MYILHRGDEWITIQDLNEDECLWLYGEGKEGNGRCVAPKDVMNSQIDAHLSKGWELV